MGMVLSLMGKKWFAGILLLLLSSLFLSSCAPCSEGIIILDGSLEDAALPEGLLPWSLSLEDDRSLRLRKEPPGEGTIPVGRISFLVKEPYEVVVEGPPGTSITTIHRTILAPATQLHEPLFSLAEEQVREYFSTGGELPQGVQMLPLEDISLPLRALPLDRNGILLYPDKASYPLIREEILIFETIPPEEQGFLNRNRYTRAYNAFQAAFSSLYAALKEDHSDRISENPPAMVGWISSVGDMMFERGVAPALAAPGGEERVFTDTLPILKGSDLTVGNLEGTISSGRRATVKSYTFSFPESILPPLKYAGFDYLMLTNNHIWDYGEEGFLDTLKALERAGIPTSGAGENLQQASRPWETTIAGQAVKVLSVGAYPRERNGFDGRSEAAATEQRSGILFTRRGAEEAISTAFSGEESFNIIYVHGGWEWKDAPDDYYEKLYRSFINQGAHLVVGSHPHVLQRMESYQGGLIAYSLGNFIFPGMEGMKDAEESLILKVGIMEGRILYVDPVPARLNGISVERRRDEEQLLEFLKLP